MFTQKYFLIFIYNLKSVEKKHFKPAVPEAKRREPMLEAWPTHQVAIGGLLFLLLSLIFVFLII